MGQTKQYDATARALIAAGRARDPEVLPPLLPAVNVATQAACRSSGEAGKRASLDEDPEVLAPVLLSSNSMHFGSTFNGSRVLGHAEVAHFDNV